MPKRALTDCEVIPFSSDVWRVAKVPRSREMHQLAFFGVEGHLVFLSPFENLGEVLSEQL